MQHTIPWKKIIFLGLIILIAIVGLWLVSALRHFSGYDVVSSRTQKDASNSSYVVLGDNIVRYGRDGAIYTDNQGHTIWNATYEMTAPAVDTCGEYLIIYDKNGTEVEVMNETGNVTDITSSYPITSAKVSKDGSVAALMQDGTVEDTDFTVDEAGQEIKYEVNFSQYITVNAQGKDFILHEMGNKIDDMTRAVQDVLDIEESIQKLKGLKEAPKYKNDKSALDRLDKMLTDADVELAQKRENMQKLFGNNMTNFQNFMEKVSSVQGKVGTTIQKLELIETRVGEQLANFKELKSSNEDIETEEAAIEMYQAEMVYNSALATTSQVIKKTLLDYI